LIIGDFDRSMVALRVTAGGLLRVDAAKVAAETNLDGKCLLRTAEPRLTSEDIALGYRLLREIGACTVTALAYSSAREGVSFRSGFPVRLRISWTAMRT
jgi:hypothetical protein